MRASHVIKGASANLMCQELREAATNLEQAAAAANHIAADDAAALESASQNVKDKYNDLKKGVENFHKFLDVADI